MRLLDAVASPVALVCGIDAADADEAEVASSSSQPHHHHHHYIIESFENLNGGKLLAPEMKMVWFKSSNQNRDPV